MVPPMDEVGGEKTNSYRSAARLAILIIHNIVCQRGLVEEALIKEATYEDLIYSCVVDPLNARYLDSTYTAIKSLLKAQSIVTARLELFDNRFGSSVESWSIQISTAAGEVPLRQHQQAMDRILSVASTLPELAMDRRFRILLLKSTSIKMPAQCAAIDGGRSTKLKSLNVGVLLQSSIAVSAECLAGEQD